MAVALIIVGCAGGESSKRAAAPSAPIVAPSFTPADYKPLKIVTGGAKADLYTAKGNLKTGIDYVAAGDTESALPPLHEADENLTDAIAKLAVAEAQIRDLEGQNKAQMADFRNNYAAKDKLLAAEVKKVAEANRKIESLQNEYTHKVRMLLTTVSALLFLAGALSIASKFVPSLAFMPGIRVGAMLIAAASITGVLALYLHLIVFWTAIALLVFVGGAALYALLHVYNHQPKAPVTIGGIGALSKD